MIDILVILLLVALLFMALLWPIRWLARLFQAERSSYGPVAVAIGTSLVFGLLLQIFLSTLVDWPITLAANFVIDVAIFTFLLGTSIIGGAIITVIENLLGSLLLVITILLLDTMGVGGVIVTDSMLMINGEPPKKSSIASYADAVCGCRRDKACLHDRFAELVFMASQAQDQGLGSEAQKQTLRARLCVNSGSRERKTSDSGTAIADTAPPAPATTDSPAAPPATPKATSRPTLNLTDPATHPAPLLSQDPSRRFPSAPVAMPNPKPPAPAAAPPRISTPQPRRARWTFAEAALSNINSYIDKSVRITRRDNGRVISGILSRSKRSNAIALEQQRYGGVFVMYIPKAQIKKLEIRTLTPR